MAGKILPCGEWMLQALMENGSFGLDNECDGIGKQKPQLFHKEFGIVRNVVEKLWQYLK